VVEEAAQATSGGRGGPPGGPSRDPCPHPHRPQAPSPGLETVAERPPRPPGVPALPATGGSCPPRPAGFLPSQPRGLPALLDRWGRSSRPGRGTASRRPPCGAGA